MLLIKQLIKSTFEYTQNKYLMLFRRFGRTDWQVSEIGYGMWGVSGWKGSDDKESEKSLNRAVEQGINFFDTAWGYGEGHSEQLLGSLLKRYPEQKLYTASKIPPKNFKWPSKRDYKLEDCFPYQHILEYTDLSLKNLGVDKIDLMQFHVWEDAWAQHEEWQRAIEVLIKSGKVASFGISVNRWEPENCLATLRTGLLDSVQVIYNIFDQAPEDTLFPICQELDIAIIARVPFDEGTLTGNINKDTKFEEGDWRRTYFVPSNLKDSVERVDRLKPLVPSGMTMAEMALRFILNNEVVSTTIPGMRKEKNVQANTAVSDGVKLPLTIMNELKEHRWDRLPCDWSQ